MQQARSREFSGQGARELDQRRGSPRRDGWRRPAPPGGLAGNPQLPVPLRRRGDGRPELELKNVWRHGPAPGLWAPRPGLAAHRRRLERRAMPTQECALWFRASDCTRAGDALEVGGAVAYVAF